MGLCHYVTILQFEARTFPMILKELAVVQRTSRVLIDKDVFVEIETVKKVFFTNN